MSDLETVLFRLDVKQARVFWWKIEIFILSGRHVGMNVESGVPSPSQYGVGKTFPDPAGRA